mgnify:CR=1 FL=1
MVVPKALVFIVVFQVPITGGTLVDEVGNIGAVSPLQSVAIEFNVVITLELTVAVTAVRDEVQEPIVESTQYVVVVEIDGVINDDPVFIETPPTDPLYQFSVPELVASKLTTPSPQRLLGVTVSVGVGFIFTEIF